MARQASRSADTAATIHDQKLGHGAGGEPHQTASGSTPVLTTAQGGPVSDDQNALRIGARGPTVLEDFHFREKIFHFDHERIPERVVHARGYGAHARRLCSGRSAINRSGSSRGRLEGLLSRATVKALAKVPARVQQATG